MSRPEVPPEVAGIATAAVTSASRAFGVTPGRITGLGRESDAVTARHVAIILMRDTGRMSYVAIATAVGRGEHSTISHAIRSVRNRVETDRKFADRYAEARRIFTGITGEVFEV